MEKTGEEKINALYERVRNLECTARRSIAFFWVAITAFIISIIAISGAFCGAPVRGINASNETALFLLGVLLFLVVAWNFIQFRMLSKKIKELGDKIGA